MSMDALRVWIAWHLATIGPVTTDDEQEEQEDAPLEPTDLDTIVF